VVVNKAEDDLCGMQSKWPPATYLVLNQQLASLACVIKVSHNNSFYLDRLVHLSHVPIMT